MQHPPEFIRPLQKRGSRARSGYSDAFCEDEMGFELLQGASGDPQEVDVGLLRGPTLALGDIGRD
jgi:hypothetical protein